MAKLLMISGHGAANLDRHGAFYNTLEEFHKHWERIDIICPRGGREAQYFGNVFVHPSSWPLLFQPFWILKKGRELFKKQSYDLVTVQEYPPFYNGIGAWLLSWSVRKPSIIEIHHIPGYPRAATLKELFYRFLSRIFLRWESGFAQAIRVVNRMQVPKFLRSSGISESKIHYIPSLYIDLDIFKPNDSSKEYDAVFVGRLVENKGVMLFLEAIKRSGLRGIIVGDGPLKHVIENKIRDEKLDIIIHGWAKDSSEVARMINESRTLVMPSYNEGGPRVVVEAMACGVPVVATSVGIVPDLIKHETSGMVVSWNAQDIAENLSRLLKDREAYDRIRVEGINIAREFERAGAIQRYAQKLQALIP